MALIQFIAFLFATNIISFPKNLQLLYKYSKKSAKVRLLYCGCVYF